MRGNCSFPPGNRSSDAGNERFNDRKINFDAWCATFVSFISIQCGLTDIMPTECGCGAMIELYRKLGRWEENDAYVPKVGDIIMYYWNDNGAGDCTGYPDHVGIVVSVSGNTITVIEANRNK